jgi:hypothetical protein
MRVYFYIALIKKNYCEFDDSSYVTFYEYAVHLICLYVVVQTIITTHNYGQMHILSSASSQDTWMKSMWWICWLQRTLMELLFYQESIVGLWFLSTKYMLSNWWNGSQNPISLCCGTNYNHRHNYGETQSLSPTHSSCDTWMKLRCE